MGNKQQVKIVEAEDLFHDTKIENLMKYYADLLSLLIATNYKLLIKEITHGKSV